MEVYNYDNYGFYLGANKADESPLEKGVFLIPANATIVKPMNFDSQYIPKFNGEEWSLVDNSLKLPQAETSSVKVPMTNAEMLREQILELQILIVEMKYNNLLGGM